MIDKYQHQDPIAKEMIMGMIGSQEAWVDAIILQGIPPEELIQFQVQEAAQVCLLFEVKGEDLR